MISFFTYTKKIILPLCARTSSVLLAEVEWCYSVVILEVLFLWLERLIIIYNADVFFFNNDFNLCCLHFLPFFPLLAPVVHFFNIWSISFFFFIIPCSICMSPFSSISSDKNADTTEISQLNVLLQTSAPESNEPEYFFSNAIQEHFQ